MNLLHKSKDSDTIIFRTMRLVDKNVFEEGVRPL